jgi:hypothetical protein
MIDADKHSKYKNKQKINQQTESVIHLAPSARSGSVEMKQELAAGTREVESAPIAA